MLKSVSGGGVDAAGREDDFLHYRYGGMYKGKHEDVSAKKNRGRVKEAGQEGSEKCARGAVKECRAGVEYTRNDSVQGAREWSSVDV